MWHSWMGTLARRATACLCCPRSPTTPFLTPRPRLLKSRPGNRELRGLAVRYSSIGIGAMGRIGQVSYRSEFVKRRRESRHLPAITFEAADLPEDVVALVDAHLLDLGGTYGVPEAGNPIQYDALRIEHDQGDVEIVVYSRAILLFRTESEAVRRFHLVCCGESGKRGLRLTARVPQAGLRTARTPQPSTCS